ncbi:sulfite exporter TauE/SafE family protein [Halomonas borealis]|uniref:sulfite exporter TauE/SafE family protein n=1 Tax=Halomonas borealis TaxID=2508710 RepID=UPI00109FA19E|nr:sulfite exporter TauE/SafE family protein [Halomonas borealis]
MLDGLLIWLDMPLWRWAGCASVLVLGAFVQRATGFGLAVVGAPLLLMLEPRLVPVTLLLMGFMLSLLMLRHYRREVHLGEIGMALLGRLPGNALGLALLVTASTVWLERWIAIGVLFAVAVSLSRARLPLNRLTLFVAGLLSGVFGTVAAIGGPPMVLLMQGMAPDRVRGNLAAFFLITSLMTLLTLALAGRVTVWHLGVSATFLPALWLGNRLAARAAARLDRRRLQQASLLLCSLAALGLLI